MKKKIIIAVVILSLFSVLLGGCAESTSTAPASTEGTTTSESNSTATASGSETPSITTSTSTGMASSSGNNFGTSSDTLQTGLPLSISQPSDGATISGDSVTVQGQTAPGATVSVDNSVVTADPTGAFSVNINLDEGLNAIDVIATDANNNQGEVLLMVNAVSTSSTSTSASSGTSQGTLPLTVTEPVDSATLTTNTVTVQGQTVPGATVTINGNSGVADENGNFSIDVSLANGPNAIDVIAMDDNGNQGEVLLMVNVTGNS